LPGRKLTNYNQFIRCLIHLVTSSKRSMAVIHFGRSLFIHPITSNNSLWIPSTLFKFQQIDSLWNTRNIVCYNSCYYYLCVAVPVVPLPDNRCRWWIRFFFVSLFPTANVLILFRIYFTTPWQNTYFIFISVYFFALFRQSPIFIPNWSHLIAL
jgi:hypothetical protein